MLVSDTATFNLRKVKNDYREYREFLQSVEPPPPPNQRVGVRSREVIATKITDGWGNNLKYVVCWRGERVVMGHWRRLFWAEVLLVSCERNEVRLPGVGLRTEPANSAQCYWLVNRRTRRKKESAELHGMQKANCSSVSFTGHHAQREAWARGRSHAEILLFSSRFCF